MLYKKQNSEKELVARPCEYAEEGAKFTPVMQLILSSEVQQFDEKENLVKIITCEIIHNLNFTCVD